MTGKGAVDTACFDVLISLIEARVDDASLFRRVLVVPARIFGSMVITLPETLNSIFWPLFRPARRRTARGTTSGVLFLTVTVIVIVYNCIISNSQ